MKGFDDCLLGSQIDGFHRNEPSGSTNGKVATTETAMDSGQRGTQFTYEESAAATKIQAGYHGFVARKELKTQNEAAVKIQSNFRGYSVRKHHKKRARSQTLPSITEEDEAAIKIQAAYRGHIARQEVIENKTKSEAAAVKIQSNFRGYCVRKHRGKDAGSRPSQCITEQEEEAAVKIQAVYRGHTARQQVIENKTKTEAATKIQAGYRGFRDRMLIGETRREEEGAAVKIQAGFRGFRVRKLRRSQSEAAVKIQSVYRGYKTRKDVHKSLTKRASLLGVSKPTDLSLAEHRDSRFSFSLPEDVKFEGDLDEDSDSDIEKVMDKMEAYKESVKNMKEIHVNPDEAAKFAAEKFDNKPEQ